MTGDQQRRLAALDSPDVEPRAGIGAFSIRRAYINLVHGTPGSAGGDGDESKSQAKIRPYTIETCYGYWVANCFVKVVDDKLEGTAAGKDEFLKGLRNWLKGQGREETIKRYLAYLQNVQNAIRDNEIDLTGEKTRKRWDRAFNSTDRIERRIDMLAENLGREAWRERLSRPFVSQRVPEIWDDVVAREAFEESFFESLAEQSRKGRTGKGKRSRAAGQLLDAIGIEDEATAEEVGEKLKESLTDPDWYRRFARMTCAPR